jgi:hypothetical protein
MNLSGTVLIVAGAADTVATRLRGILETAGQRVAYLDGPSAARIFTVRVTENSTSVLPIIPMFIRASAWWHDMTRENTDERFLRAEAYATFWAATALSPAVVINRPRKDVNIDRLTAGMIATQVSSGAWSLDPEVYASGPEVISGEHDDSLWGEDIECTVAPVRDLRRGVPLRARKLNPHAHYEIVTVVGSRAFLATQDARSSELNVVHTSVSLAQAVGMHFGTIIWAIDDEGATPVRLNACPEEAELRYAWKEVATALCEDLQS